VLCVPPADGFSSAPTFGKRGSSVRDLDADFKYHVPGQLQPGVQAAAAKFHALRWQCRLPALGLCRFTTWCLAAELRASRQHHAVACAIDPVSQAGASSSSGQDVAQPRASLPAPDVRRGGLPSRGAFGPHANWATVTISSRPWISVDSLRARVETCGSCAGGLCRIRHLARDQPAGPEQHCRRAN